ncbi:hypothetical protein Ait01nite_068920 [Actinoplanes italicus]|uniref:Heparinase II/III-like protein n=1 Tax=Actinoplanes italicus TaxID=113567 RepID=A0A2T0K1G4_9ACTN|nr:hypothetical protein [Actinoplanes italicus]PRX16639.1 hypothetical protein CLV67_119220 [Actinoplanes italicus]GIE33847.1 hypothetical protein Ait01nite_068920 [Actinoplanes italicus]
MLFGNEGGLTDNDFTDRVRAALDREVRGILAETGLSWRAMQHRRLAERIKTLAAAWRLLGTPAPPRQAAVLLGAAERLAGLLRERQNPGGLFRGGDNIDSPPDTAAGVNDLADAALLLRRAGDPAAGPLADTLGQLLAAATPALLTGGVHTPSHRWELSAALARLHRLDPRPELAGRAGQWLAEGVDVEDGLYSERSADYAAHVSNPSLMIIAEVFDRPGLLGHVERNLTATLDLLLPDGTVETVLSRRQDQRGRVRLEAFLLPLRVMAALRSRPDLAWAAGIALEQGIESPGTAAAELLLCPVAGAVLPPSAPPLRPRLRHFRSAGTVVAHGPATTAVVFGGSDYSRHRRIRSGLANSPTLLRLHAGAAVLDSVRLSRTFFGVGPFRADGLVLEPGPVAVMRESVTAAYYQPLAPEDRDEGGRYRLGDDGRFSAAMSFGRRARDEVTLNTTVRVALREEAMEVVGEGLVEVAVEMSGATVDWALELAFRPGGTMTGARALGSGRWVLEEGPATYRVGGDELRVTVAEAPGMPAESDPVYHPGEDYEFLGGTDAVVGELLYVTGKSPSRLRLRIDVAVI